MHATPPVCGRWLRRRYRRKIARRSLRSQEPEPDGRNENKPPRETGAALPRYGVTIARAKRSIAKPRRLSPSAPDVLKIELLTNPGMHRMNSPEQDDVRRERELLKSEQESHRIRSKNCCGR